MLIAIDRVNRKLIVGLHAENVERLLNDQPIEKRLREVDGVDGVPELADWTLYVLGPEDLARFVAHFAP